MELAATGGGQPPMRFTRLDAWLAWQERLHPRTIELGLERPGQVLKNLDIHPAFTVITVAGTNGKGSSVVMLESILRAAGLRVGTYTSPHLLRYNERIRVNGEAVSDAVLCEAFARIDEARGDISLTYFEFGTLAALDIFARSRPDAVILEVGMGGRLDAVNLVDADAALVTSIALDHCDWLGTDRESIAREKAGIFRAGRPAVYAEPDAPATLLEYARGLEAPLYRLGHEYGYERRGGTWDWWGSEWRFDGLPLPALLGPVQVQNAAGVLAVLERLRDRFPLGREHLCRGLAAATQPGRFQLIPGPVPQILDVAHNPQAAQELAAGLRAAPVTGRTHAVFAALADKDIPGVVAPLKELVDRWHVAGLDVPRGGSGDEVAAILSDIGVPGVTAYRSVAEARRGALEDAVPGDRVVVFGSFHTVAEALAELL